MLRSVAAVVGSYLLSIALVLATDPLLSRLFPNDFTRGRVPSNTALLASTALFVLVSIFCAWLCARLSPGRGKHHVFWFMVIGEVMGIAATIPNWSKGWPHWYWLSWLLTWPLSCWIGLMLSGRASEQPSPEPAS
jgi:amino acid permease